MKTNYFGKFTLSHQKKNFFERDILNIILKGIILKQYINRF